MKRITLNYDTVLESETFELGQNYSLLYTTLRFNKKSILSDLLPLADEKTYLNGKVEKYSTSKLYYKVDRLGLSKAQISNYYTDLEAEVGDNATPPYSEYITSPVKNGVLCHDYPQYNENTKNYSSVVIAGARNIEALYEIDVELSVDIGNGFWEKMNIIDILMEEDYLELSYSVLITGDKYKYKIKNFTTGDELISVRTEFEVISEPSPLVYI